MAVTAHQKRMWLQGLKVPKQPTSASRTPKKFLDELECVVEALMERGVCHSSKLSQVTGIKPVHIRKVQAAVVKRWGEVYTSEKVNFRREQLYKEATRVSLEAWELLSSAKNDDDFANCLKALKVVIDSNKRRATLTGLDEIKISATLRQEVEINQSVEVNVIHEVEDSFGLAAGALKTLGSQLAIAMNPNTTVIEVTDEQD